MVIETALTSSPLPLTPHTAPPAQASWWRQRIPLLCLGLTVTAALIVGLVPGASTPTHASTNVWDRLALCESSGNWSINTGNGYYGGVQFSLSTWREFGGTDYAERADLASKAAQIYIATRVWRQQGWNAWPTCTRKLNITAPAPAARRPAVPSVPVFAAGGTLLNLRRTPHTVVSFDSTQQHFTPFQVQRGHRYRLVMAGKYRWNRTASRADATCSLHNRRWVSIPPGSKHSQELNVMVGHPGAQRGNWTARSGGACDPNHVYYMDFRATRTSKLLINTKERTRSDNYGTLQLHVLPYQANISKI